MWLIFSGESGDGSISLSIVIFVIVLIIFYCCLVFLFFYCYKRKERHYQDRGKVTLDVCTLCVHALSFHIINSTYCKQQKLSGRKLLWFLWIFDESRKFPY